MATIGRRGAQGIQEIVLAAQGRFTELGIRTTVRIAASPEDTALVAADRRVFPLDDLIALASRERGRARKRLIDEYIGRLVREGPGLDRMEPEDLRARIRCTLLPAAGAPGYARPFSDDLVEALAIQLPETVVAVTDDLLGRLTLPVAELFVFGRQHTAAEPVEERTQVAPGVVQFDGASPFLAAKAVDLVPLLGSPRFGIVFAVPHRQTLLAVPIEGEQALASIDGLARGLTGLLTRDPQGFPGGVLSASLHFSRNGEVQVVSDVDPVGGAMRILATGAFGDALDEIEAAGRALPPADPGNDSAVILHTVEKPVDNSVEEWGTVRGSAAPEPARGPAARP